MYYVLLLKFIYLSSAKKQTYLSRKEIAMKNVATTVLSQLLRAKRKAAGMTQKDLARKVGVAIQVISQWENDVLPPFKRRDKLCQAVGLTNEDFDKMIPETRNILPVIKLLTKTNLDMVSLEDIIFLLNVEAQLKKPLDDVALIEGLLTRRYTPAPD